MRCMEGLAAGGGPMLRLLRRLRRRRLCWRSRQADPQAPPPPPLSSPPPIAGMQRPSCPRLQMLLKRTHPWPDAAAVTLTTTTSGAPSPTWTRRSEGGVAGTLQLQGTCLGPAGLPFTALQATPIRACCHPSAVARHAVLTHLPKPVAAPPPPTHTPLSQDQLGSARGTGDSRGGAPGPGRPYRPAAGACGRPGSQGPRPPAARPPCPNLGAEGAGFRDARAAGACATHSVGVGGTPRHGAGSIPDRAHVIRAMVRPPPPPSGLDGCTARSPGGRRPRRACARPAGVHAGSTRDRPPGASAARQRQARGRRGRRAAASLAAARRAARGASGEGVREVRARGARAWEVMGVADGAAGARAWREGPRLLVPGPGGRVRRGSGSGVSSRGVFRCRCFLRRRAWSGASMVPERPLHAAHGSTPATLCACVCVCVRFCARAGRVGAPSRSWWPPTWRRPPSPSTTWSQ